MEDSETDDLKENQNFHCNQIKNIGIKDNNFNSSSELFSFSSLPTTSASESSLNYDSTLSPSMNSTDSTPIKRSQFFVPYAYPFPYPWCPPPLAHKINIEEFKKIPFTYASPISREHSPISCSVPSVAPGTPTDHVNNAGYPVYYPVFVYPTQNLDASNSTDLNDLEKLDQRSFYPYPTPPFPYISYPHPVQPTYTLSPTSSRASSLLPDIIITPSTEDIPSTVTVQHNIKIKQEKPISTTEVEEVHDSMHSSSKTDLYEKLEFACNDSENTLDLLNSKECAGELTNKSYSMEKNNYHVSSDDDSSAEHSEVTPKNVYENMGTQTIKSLKKYCGYSFVINDTNTCNESDNTTVDSDKDEDEYVEETNIKDFNSIDEKLQMVENNGISSKLCFGIHKNNKETNLSEQVVTNKSKIEANENEEDIDFFAALRATKLETQKIREESINYWKNIATIDTSKNNQEQYSDNFQSTQEIHTVPLNGEQEMKHSIESVKNIFSLTVAATENFNNSKNNNIDENKRVSTKKIETGASLYEEFIKEIYYSPIVSKIQDYELKKSKKAEISVYYIQNEVKDEDKLVNAVIEDMQYVVDDEDTDNEQEEVVDEEEDKENDEEENGEEDKVLEEYDEKQDKVLEVEMEHVMQMKNKIAEQDQKDEDTVQELQEFNITNRIMQDNRENNLLHKTLNISLNKESLKKETQEETKEVKCRGIKYSFIKPPNIQYEETENLKEDEEEIDFWAEIEKSKSDTNTVINNTISFDPMKYPEEPREVDTDEEIDFWKEIEEKKYGNKHKSFCEKVSFWSNKKGKTTLSEQETDLSYESKNDEKFLHQIKFAKGEEAVLLETSNIKCELNSNTDNKINFEEKNDIASKRKNYHTATAFFRKSIDERFEKQPQTAHAEHTLAIKKNILDNNNKYQQISVDPSKSDAEQFNDGIKVSVRQRISVFESSSTEKAFESKKDHVKTATLIVNNDSTLSRNNSSQRSESEIEEDDSGVTDMNRQFSETDTESESFPELRKLTSYQRASTHSRLYKLLQVEDITDNRKNQTEKDLLRPSRRKIIHNVSITRKQNPSLLSNAETMIERRERLSLPLCNKTSIDADNPSTPNSPASPILGISANDQVVSEKLVNELVQSLLLKYNNQHIKQLPMNKLQAAAKRVLEEEFDSLENTSFNSTPALTPNDSKSERSYLDYYASWSDATCANGIFPSKAFQNLQDKISSRPNTWVARCPRVLNSKIVNRDLARVTESPEIANRTTKSPECFSKEYKKKTAS